MKTKHILITLSIIGGMALCACSQTLSPEVPKTVTDPRMVQTYQKAVSGDCESLKTIAKCFENGTNGFPKSEQKMMNAYRMAAERGDGRAQFMLGWKYCLGTGPLKVQRTQEGLSWLKKAMVSGDKKTRESAKLKYGWFAREYERERVYRDARLHGGMTKEDWKKIGEIDEKYN